MWSTTFAACVHCTCLTYYVFNLSLLKCPLFLPRDSKCLWPFLVSEPILKRNVYFNFVFKVVTSTCMPWCWPQAGRPDLLHGKVLFGQSFNFLQIHESEILVFFLAVSYNLAKCVKQVFTIPWGRHREQIWADLLRMVGDFTEHSWTQVHIRAKAF